MGGFKPDPAVELFGAMRRSTRVYYRLTPGKLFNAFIVFVAFPSFIAWAIIKGVVHNLF